MARELRRRKNNKCDWWVVKSTGGYQIISDDENEEEAPSIERLNQRDIRVMRQLEEACSLSLTQASSSFADKSSLPTNTQVCPPIPEHLRLSPSAEEADDEEGSDDDVEEEE